MPGRKLSYVKIIKKMSKTGMSNTEIAQLTGVDMEKVKKITATPDFEIYGAAMRDLLLVGWPPAKIAEAFGIKESRVAFFVGKAAGEYAV